MISERELLKFHPLDRARIRVLSFRLNQKESEREEIAKSLEYKSKLINELSEKLDPYKGEMLLEPSVQVGLEQSRRKIVLERNTYEDRMFDLEKEIESLSSELRPLIAEKEGVDFKKFALPLILIIICVPIIYLSLSGSQSTTGYSFLLQPELTSSVIGLIFVLVVIAISLKYLR